MTHEFVRDVLAVSFGQLETLELVSIQDWEGGGGYQSTRLLRLLPCGERVKQH